MIEDAIDGEMVEEAMEAVDVVLLWWRDEDGDLVDGLMDALTDLTGTGYIWLMTPKVGRGGYVDAADLAEAAVTAGLALTTSAAVSAELGGHQARPAARARGGDTGASDEPAAGLHRSQPARRAGRPGRPAWGAGGDRLLSRGRSPASAAASWRPCAMIMTGSWPSEHGCWRSPVTRCSPSGRTPMPSGSASTCSPTTGRTARSPQAYGVFDEQAGCALRGTFVLDAEGVISWRRSTGSARPRLRRPAGSLSESARS